TAPMGVLLLLLLLQTPAALMEPEFCYILDAILFIYGIILTTIYCRLKVSTGGTPPPPPQFRLCPDVFPSNSLIFGVSPPPIPCSSPFTERPIRQA
uniref:Uncharacterized protein n=1 Tax=Melopsittacus undulatus TaxID=13146 RepID=A0A8V5H393_MELUD